MSPEIYEVLSQGARYWFLFLMGIIVWRSYRWLAKDRKQRKKRLRLLPDAGFIGELVVQTGNEALPPGTVFPVPREGFLGSSRACDLCVPLEGVARKHLWFRFEDGVGLRVSPTGRNPLEVDGLGWENRRQGLLMLHGSRLALGEGLLRLRMFAGFETAAHAAPLEASDLPEDMEDAQEEAFRPAAGQAAMTPEQLTLWQAQQQRYWAMAAQAMAAQAAVQAVQAVSPHTYAPLAASGVPEGLEEADGGYGDQPLQDPDEAFGEDCHAALQEEWEPPFQEGLDSASPSQPVFYPPVQDEGEDGDWPYALYPQSDLVFENHGYTYPELVEAGLQEEDLTDAAAPPKSLYVEPDEAERAKELLWDRYLGGRKRR